MTSSPRGLPVPADNRRDIPNDRAVVDRIVDDTTAVLLVGPQEHELTLAADLLPEGASEGVWVVVDVAGKPPTVTGIDEQLTEARASDLAHRLDRLRRQRTGGRFRRP
jgi:hypothetical protein